MQKKSISMSKNSDECKFKHLHMSNSQPNIKENSQYKKLSDKYASTNKMRASNRKFNKTLFSKLAKRIEERAVSFFYYGLRESQKAAHKSVFMDVFNRKNSDLKGSMSIGELWDNKNSIIYLKENRMFFNKDVLLEELKNLNKQRKIEKRMERKTKGTFLENYQRLSNLNGRSTDLKREKKFELATENPKESCIKIRNQIDSLLTKKKGSEVKNRKILEKLQNDQKKIDYLSEKFHDKMIVLI